MGLSCRIFCRIRQVLCFLSYVASSRISFIFCCFGDFSGTISMILACLEVVTFIVSLQSILFSFSWIFARKWPAMLQGPHLGRLCDFLSLCAWMIIISPVLVLILWGCWLIVILGRDLIGLAIIMAGSALLLAFYSIMLWWRTQWQSSSIFSILTIPRDFFISCLEDISYS